MKKNLLLHLSDKAFLLICCFAYTGILCAQNPVADSANNMLAINNAIDAYHQYLFPETNLYNGSEYVDYAYTINEGIPFFEVAQFSPGSVAYDNVVYTNVPILFDEVKEEVVVQTVLNANKITLNSERVTSFSLLNHHFVKLIQDSTGKSPIRTGFYDVLYQGNSGIYKRETKKILESINIGEGLRRKIDVLDEYFFKKENTFYTVSSKRDVLNITKDRKKEIQQYIKKNKLNLRTAKETALIKIAAYYDQLTFKN